MCTATPHRHVEVVPRRWAHAAANAHGSSTEKWPSARVPAPATLLSQPVALQGASVKHQRGEKSGARGVDGLQPTQAPPESGQPGHTSTCACVTGAHTRWTRTWSHEYMCVRYRSSHAVDLHLESGLCTNHRSLEGGGRYSKALSNSSNKEQWAVRSRKLKTPTSESE